VGFGNSRRPRSFLKGELNMKYILVAGLPQSGSTLLTNIIKYCCMQNGSTNMAKYRGGWGGNTQKNMIIVLTNAMGCVVF